MRQFLSCKMNNLRTSYETAVRAICILRMTRWMHLAAALRDPLIGQMQKTTGTVHNAPLPCQDVCTSDPDYIELLKRSVANPHQMIRMVATNVLNERTSDTALPTHLRQRVAQARWAEAGDNGNGPTPPNARRKTNRYQIPMKRVRRHRDLIRSITTIRIKNL